MNHRILLGEKMIDTQYDTIYNRRMVSLLNNGPEDFVILDEVGKSNIPSAKTIMDDDCVSENEVKTNAVLKQHYQINFCDEEEGYGTNYPC